MLNASPVSMTLMKIISLSVVKFSSFLLLLTQRYVFDQAINVSMSVVMIRNISQKGVNNYQCLRINKA